MMLKQLINICVLLKDVETAFSAFKEVLLNNPTITHIDIRTNIIGNVCGEILSDVPARRKAAGAPIIQMKVDSTLEMSLFKTLWIDGKAGKKGGKKGKKKKKK